MKLLNLCILLAAWSSISTSQEALIYPDPKSITRSSIMQLGSLVIEDLFSNSDFVLTPRAIPTNFRRLLDLQDKRVDILVLPYNTRVAELLPTNIITVYPEPLFDTPVYYYWLHSENHKKEITAPTIKLGTIRMPQVMLEAFFNIPYDNLSTFSNYQSMAKALLSKRIDAMIGNPLDIEIALTELEATSRIIKGESPFTLHFHLGVRTSLDSRVQTSIFFLLKQRLPKFKELGRAEKILNTYSVKH